MVLTTMTAIGKFYVMIACDSFLSTFITAAALAACLGCQATGRQKVSVSDTEPMPYQEQSPAPLTSPQQNKASLKLAYARTIEAEGELDRAISIYLELLQQNESTADAHWRLGLIYSKQGSLVKASTHFRAVLAQRSNDPDILCDLGYVLYLQEFWGDAEAKLRKAIAVEPGHQRAHMNLGLLLARIGQPEKAEREFLAAGCTSEVARSNVMLTQSIQRKPESKPVAVEPSIANDAAAQIQQAAYFEEKNQRGKKKGPRKARSRRNRRRPVENHRNATEFNDLK